MDETDNEQTRKADPVVGTNLSTAPGRGISMEIIERTLNDTIVFELDGNLALEGNAQFRKKVSAAIDAGARKLIVNLGQVDYMDSNGLGELIACHTKLKNLHGRLALLEVNKRLTHLLVITKLHTVFETFASESAAIACFAQQTESEAPGDANIARLS